MKVSELGEFGLIDRIAGIVNSNRDETAASWKNLLLGMGDDAAAWYGDGSIQLATVDFLRQGIHFDMETTGWADLGWKALAVNLSDIAAMGGIPGYALVSLALPDRTEVEDVIALYTGMSQLARQFDTVIAGGDFDKSPLINIGITVIGGTCNRALPLTRSTAAAGDKIAVTGYLGSAAAGLEMLTKHLQLGDEDADYLRQALLRPHPRISEGQILADRGVRTAIDISDGLAADLNHVCKSSHVGARVEVDRVPVSPAVRANFGGRALDLALSGGEDYELLFTASDKTIERVRAAVSCPVTIIGEIVADENNEVKLVDTGGRTVYPARSGWEHFKTN